METRTDEIAAGVYRLSTFVPEVEPGGLVFNQFLVVGDEALLFHTGPRALFPLVQGAVARVMAPEKLRWIAFGHFEADECGSMNDWLAVAPRAEVAHGVTACGVSLADTAARAPRVLADGEVIDLGGGRRVRYIDTPHIPHGWEAGVMFEESSRLLLCGDLFTQYGHGPVRTHDDIVGPANAAEDVAHYSSLHPTTGSTLRRLAALAPRTLALMHGPAYEGDGAAALNALATSYDKRIRAALVA